MKCKYCGTMNTNGEVNCKSCGSDLTQVTLPKPPTFNAVPPKKKTNLIPIFIIIIIILLVIIGLLLFKNNKTNQEPTNKENNTTSTETTKSSTSSTPSGDRVYADVKEELAKEKELDKNASLIMPIEDVFTISGRGTVATGQVESGTVNVGDTIEIIRIGKEPITTSVGSIEMFRKTYDTAVAGDNVGILLTGVERDDVARGDVIVKPSTMTSHKSFEAEIYMLTKEEGGRHTPIATGAKSQFYLRTTDITGTITLEKGKEMIMPGDNNAKISVELEKTAAMKVGDVFAIREGGRTIGKGIITKIN